MWQNDQTAFMFPHDGERIKKLFNSIKLNLLFGFQIHITLYMKKRFGKVNEHETPFTWGVNQDLFDIGK